MHSLSLDAVRSPQSSAITAPPQYDFQHVGSRGRVPDYYQFCREYGAHGLARLNIDVVDDRYQIDLLRYRHLPAHGSAAPYRQDQHDIPVAEGQAKYGNQDTGE
jgi:hypothetical protein